MNERAKQLTEWLNHYIKTDPAHKVIARRVFGHNGDCGDYGEDWMWIDDICKQTVNFIESLTAQLEQITRERDALLDELKGECDVCANRKDCTAPKCRKSQHNECEKCPCYTCIYDTNWKWEGVKVNQ